MRFAVPVATAAVLGLQALAAAPAVAAEELKFANFMPAGHPYVASTFQPFADAVAEATGGEVTVTLYNGGELGGGPVEQYSRVVDGVTELAIGLPGYTASSFPLTLTTELPGLIEEKTGTEEIWSNIDLFLPEYRRVVLVALWSSAENVLYTRDKAVHSPDDIKGLKIRVPSRNAGLLVEAWGGVPVSMPVPEIYNAMQTGVIDGAMIDGTATKAFKLGEVANFLTVGMETTNSPFFILMNRDVADELSGEQLEAIEAAGKQASLNGSAMQQKVAADGIESFAAMEGKTLIRLSDAEAAKFDALAEGMMETLVAGMDAKQKAVVDALKAN
ncbi:TRAP transporter substrate-binding protein [Albimonas pacifica]|uniref:TRAP-type C4-dicarboxylate transport system, substrate-binding protein n=1 Tax=Albimonas pacifica TaxID=1114924 RepID=A0A1I3FT63_9RHOB|nr:TRAP transporter substrate-binding protein [Albimonas pacifica]SFI14389.1 TRAP-type C4-dicarboxylate transport system, substrate-binding protein [Albimonas pacifica]